MQRLQDKALTAFHNAETAWQQVNVHDLAEQARDPKAIGVFLAFSSSAFIGASFVITRKALQRAAARVCRRHHHRHQRTLSGLLTRHGLRLRRAASGPAMAATRPLASRFGGWER